MRVEEYAWDRIGDHSFVRRGGAVRTCVVTVGRDETHVLSGVQDLVVLNSTDSEFKGFLKDEFTTLAETDDRILATSLVAHVAARRAPRASTGTRRTTTVRAACSSTFADTYSRALQETLHAMGTRGARRRSPGIAEIAFSAPNKHHFLVDFSGFDVDGADQRRRGLHRRRPALRPDRGAGDPRRRATRGRRVAARAGVLLMPMTETTREVLLGCLSVPRWADDVLAGQPYADRRRAARRRRPGRPGAHRRGARPGAVRPPPDRRARRRPVAARSSPASTRPRATPRPGSRPATRPTRSGSTGSS